jgi:hypothetical protein
MTRKKTHSEVAMYVYKYATRYSAYLGLRVRVCGSARVFVLPICRLLTVISDFAAEI